MTSLSMQSGRHVKSPKIQKYGCLAPKQSLENFRTHRKNFVTSIEVDVQPKNRPDKIDAIDGALGELSLFHQTHGFYVHGLPIEEAATLPQGWAHRATPVFDEISTNGKTGWCVEAHDLAASKLVAYREKDRDFVRILLIEEMINPQTLIERICTLRIDGPLRNRFVQWVESTAEEL